MPIRDYGISIFALCAAITAASDASANDYRSNPPIAVDLSTVPQFAPVGELQRDENLGNGTTAHIGGSSVIVSPCHVLTAFHVAFGLDKKPVPGKNYTASFRAGQGTEVGAFAGRTDAVPVLWGDYNPLTKENDWAILRLHSCVGVSSAFGWVEATSHTQTELVNRRQPIVAVGYSYKNNIRAQHSMGFGNIIGYDIRTRMMTFDASIAKKESGGAVFSFENGTMKLIGLNTAEKYLDSDKRSDGSVIDTFDQWDAGHANLAQGAFEILNRSEVRALLDADKGNRINPARARLERVNGGDLLVNLVVPMVADCGTAVKNSDLPTEWSGDTDGLGFRSGPTPAKLRGVETVSVRQAMCLLRSPRKPLVLAALEDRLGIPGALALPWATMSGNLGDGVTSKLGVEVKQRTGGDFDHPLLVYCHHSNCWMSVMVAKRLVAAGFRQVYWLRDGLSAWSEGDGPLAPVTRITSPLVAADISTPLPTAVIAADAWTSHYTLDGAVSVELPGPTTITGLRSGDNLVQIITGNLPGGIAKLFVITSALFAQPKGISDYTAQLCFGENITKIHGTMGCSKFKHDPPGTGRLSMIYSQGERVIQATGVVIGAQTAEGVQTTGFTRFVDSIMVQR